MTPEKLSAPRGTADFFPPESGRWSALEARIRALAERFGYGEIRTPVFESTELFVRGVGEHDRHRRKRDVYGSPTAAAVRLTLRPEWTAPVVRAALEHHLFAQGPLRLYYIGPIFRYERPQKGRYRQSHQFGVECFGFPGPEADLEVISLAWELVRSYGIADATLNLNSLGDDRCRPRYRDALLAHFRPNLAKMSDDSHGGAWNATRCACSTARIRPTRRSSRARRRSSRISATNAANTSMRSRRISTSPKIPFTINPRIVRGLDYYNRTVFEITSNVLGAQSAVCGGGRYDGLVRSLGGPDVPAVGFALGMERFLLMVDALRSRGRAAAPRRPAIALGAQARTVVVPLVAELRRAARRARSIADYNDRKLLAHLKNRRPQRARYALISAPTSWPPGSSCCATWRIARDRRVPLGDEWSRCRRSRRSDR